MVDKGHVPARVRWARFRFLIVGPLLTSPPDAGELSMLLDELASRAYRHPTTGERARFGRSTIERWYYAAKNEPKDPIRALERKVHGRAGTHPSVGDALRDAIVAQHRTHPRWSFKLHYDNLLALAQMKPELGTVPGVAVVTRFMKSRGLCKQRTPRKRRDADNAPVFEARERRSFEVGHVHALWHSDFHEGSRAVIDAHGKWHKPRLLGFLDDCSRVATRSGTSMRMRRASCTG